MNPLTVDQKVQMLIGAYAIQITVLESRVQELEAKLADRSEPSPDLERASKIPLPSQVPTPADPNM